jgi:hypothetical protein
MDRLGPLSVLDMQSDFYDIMLNVKVLLMKQQPLKAVQQKDERD